MTPRDMAFDVIRQAHRRRERAKQERAEALACLDLAEDFAAECIVAGNLAWYDLAIAEAEALREELGEMEKWRGD